MAAHANDPEWDKAKWKQYLDEWKAGLDENAQKALEAAVKALEESWTNWKSAVDKLNQAVNKKRVVDNLAFKPVGDAKNGTFKLHDHIFRYLRVTFENAVPKKLTKDEPAGKDNGAGKDKPKPDEVPADKPDDKAPEELFFKV